MVNAVSVQRVIPPKKRIDFITWMQFIGVLSVVFGHSMNGIAVPEFFKEIKAWVYVWHMPLFFLVSAFLFSYTGGFKKGIKKVLYKKAKRLLVPYLIWNVAFLFPKIVMSAYINDKAELSFDYFIQILFYPRYTVLGHTWFLFALFVAYLATVVLDKLLSKKQLWIPVLSVFIVFNALGVTSRFLAIDDLMKNGIFFCIGLIVGKFDIDTIISWFKDRYVFVASVILTVLSTVLWIFCRNVSANTLLLGIAFLFMLAMLQVNFNITSKTIEFVSRNSFPIYIMHWPVMMMIRFVFYTKLSFQPIITMLIMFVGGVLVPAVIVLVLGKIRWSFIKKIYNLIFGI